MVNKCTPKRGTSAISEVRTITKVQNQVPEIAVLIDIVQLNDALVTSDGVQCLNLGLDLVQSRHPLIVARTSCRTQHGIWCSVFGEE